MTNAQRILDAVVRRGPLTDAELVVESNVRPHQQVNQICRKLAAQGDLRRVRVVGRGIVNFTADADAERHPGPNRSAASTSAGTKTLFIIPCSGRKLPGGVREDTGPSVIDLLPSQLGAELGHARKQLAPLACVDESLLLTARHRYAGTLYIAAGRALDASESPTLILSGGYGLLLLDERIGSYDRRFSLSDWPQGLLERCVVAILEQADVSEVRAFCARSTSYAALLRRVPWPASVDARIVAPAMNGRCGAQVLVPRASGQAFAATVGGSIKENWTSSDGVAVNMEVLTR